MMNIATTTNVSEATVITHGGIFHADEVMATVILSKIFDEVKVLRTFKVPDNLNESVIVYDIGFGKYDHHQKGGNGIRENEVPYASAGLIWKNYGREICVNTPNPEMVWKLIDTTLIQGIDAIDNGAMPKADYPASAMSLSACISSFNPTWDSEENADEAFLKAVAFAEIVFDNALKTAISKAKAESIVEDSLNNSDGKVLILDKFVPWQDVLFSTSNSKAETVLFVVFPSIRGGFNWQCVPTVLGSFEQRKPVPAEWKGAKPEILQELTGAASATFCHPAGFLGATGTLEDAIKMVRIAIEA